MKKLFTCIFCLFPLLLFAQAEKRYVDTDIYYATQTIFDTSFAEIWEIATMHFEGADGWLRYTISARDTMGWKSGSREWLHVPEGIWITITRSGDLYIPGLSKIEIAVDSTEADTALFYISGVRRMK
jgi:hypothetical protein